MDIADLLARDPRVWKHLDNHTRKQFKNRDKKYILDSTIAMSGLRFAHPDKEVGPEYTVSLPPYVLAQILSENVVAYDLYNIAESIAPILQNRKNYIPLKSRII